MATVISPISQAPSAAVTAAAPAVLSTTQKIIQFFTRIEGIGTVFSILAGTAVALLWSVSFGLLAGAVGIAISLAIGFCGRGSAAPQPPEGEDKPQTTTTAAQTARTKSLEEPGDTTVPADTRTAAQIAYQKILDEADRDPVPAPTAAPTAPVKMRGFSADENIAFYKETMAEGLRRFTASIDKMKANSAVVEQQTPLAAHPNYDSKIYVTNKSTLRTLQDLVKRGLKPLGLNMANLSTAGGGARRGANAQEEILCRQSTTMHGLLLIEEGGHYPMPELGGVYTPHVTFFRADPNESYAFLPDEEVFETGMYAMAAYQCNTKWHCDRPADDATYIANTREKIRSYIRFAVKNGYDSLVPSAFGCGAFKNDPKVIAQLFKEELESPEFKGCFKEVAFGIIEDSASGGVNFATFEGILGGE